MKKVKIYHNGAKRDLKLQIFAVIAVYLGALALSLLVTVRISKSESRRMQYFLEEEAEYYAIHNHLHLLSSESVDNIIAFYNLHGQCIALLNLENEAFDSDAIFQELIAKCESGGIEEALGISKDIHHYFYYAAAMPVVLGVTQIGYICRVQVESEMIHRLIDLFSVITAVMAAALISVVYTAKATMKLQKIRSSYIANVSHSLKTPIASLRAIGETLSDGLVTEPEKIRAFGSLILSESAALEKTVMDMMELSRMQNKKSDFTKSTVQPEELFAPAIARYSVLCDDLDVTFHPPELSQVPPLWTNRERVQTLLDIFLDNAMKFVKEEGDIWLTVTADKRRVTISVRDNGIGIPRELQSRIFERFYKQDVAHNERGSGLGLAIARQIVAGLEEELWVESEPGKGAAFFFTISTAEGAIKGIGQESITN